jgi:hypothetical protein
MHVPTSSLSLITKGVELVRARLSTRHRNRTRLEQVRGEVETCANMAFEVRQSWHKLPTTQLQYAAWDQFGHELHSADSLATDEYNTLRAFFSCCAQINSAVQAAGAVDLYGNRMAGLLVYRPAQLSDQLLLPRDGSLSLYDEAQAALSAAISRMS